MLRGQPRWVIKAHGAQEIPLFVDAARTSFVQGKRVVRLTITTDGFAKTLDATLLGPIGDTQ